MRIGWSPFGAPYLCGLAPSPRKDAAPLRSAADLIRQACAWGLEGVEFPITPFVPDASMAALRDLRAAAEAAGLFLHVAAGGYTLERLRQPLEVASALGARVVRTVIGGVKIGGDRREIAHRLPEFLAEVRRGLSMVAPLARDLGVRVGIENHQDLTSDELIALVEESSSPPFGITLDTGNPLATVEHPLDFAERVLPYLVDVHLKDYTVHWSESGYRLARVPLGRGVIPFDRLFALFERAPFRPDAVVELGALQARHVRWLEDDFWPGYPPRPAPGLVPALRFAWRHRAPDGADWRTPEERGEPAEGRAAWERAQMEESIRFLGDLRKKAS